MTTTTPPSTEEPSVVAYVVQNAPVTYLGEYLESGDDELVYLGKPMLFAMDPEGKAVWNKPRACGQDSIMSITPKFLPGMLVLRPDSELVQQYKKEYLHLYSKITLLR